MRVAIHIDKTGRLFWIDESHPSTDARHVMCRVIENGKMQHSSLRSRANLTLYLLTDMDEKGVITLRKPDSNPIV